MADDGCQRRCGRDGLAQLVETVANAPHQDLDSLLDKLLVGLVGNSGSDDVALLAVRIVDPHRSVATAESTSRQVFVLPDDLSAAAVARARVRTTCTGLAEESLHDAVLLTSELVGNALRHGRPPAVLMVDTSPSTVTIGVSDRDPWLPPTNPSRPDPGEPTGRGLLIVQALATEWGVTPRRAGGPGKTVWFRLAAS